MQDLDAGSDLSLATDLNQSKVFSWRFARALARLDPSKAKQAQPLERIAYDQFPAEVRD